MDSKFEVTGAWPGVQAVSLAQLAEAMERFYFDEMAVGDTLVIKRIS